MTVLKLALSQIIAKILRKKSKLLKTIWINTLSKEFIHITIIGKTIIKSLEKEGMF